MSTCRGAGAHGEEHRRPARGAPPAQGRRHQHRDVQARLPVRTSRTPPRNVAPTVLFDGLAADTRPDAQAATEGYLDAVPSNDERPSSAARGRQAAVVDVLIDRRAQPANGIVRSLRGWSGVVRVAGSLLVLVEPRARPPASTDHNFGNQLVSIRNTGTLRSFEFEHNLIRAPVEILSNDKDCHTCTG